MIKTENTIWSFIIDKFNKELRANGYGDWMVLRNYQPSIQGLRDKSIYLYKISKRRIGTQGLKTEKDNDNQWQTVDHWYEEIMFQVGAFCKRNPETETISTITSEDVLDTLMAYINSSTKVTEWKTAGYEVIKATNMRLMDYETDSGLQEKLPQFDFLLCVEQSKLKKIAKFDSINIETKRV